MDLGFSGEMVFLAFLGLILFGPRKLPEIAKTAGRFIAELKRASNEFQGQFNREIGELDVVKPAKTLSSLAERIRAANAAGSPGKAIMALADPKEQISGPSFITNLPEYLSHTSGAAETQAQGQPVKPAETSVAETNGPATAAEKISVQADNGAV
jgi:Sec-independent protein translocase protein TatA